MTGYRQWFAVENEVGCWIWQGAAMGSYGQLEVNGRHILAHRWAALLVVGYLPQGIDWHHQCETKSCIRIEPGHVMPLDHGEHTAVHQPVRDACSEGHPFDESNTYWRRGRNGRQSRQCRRCKSIRQCRYDRQARTEGRK